MFNKFITNESIDRIERNDNEFNHYGCYKGGAIGKDLLEFSKKND